MGKRDRCRYIVENYDSLPEVVAFVHGHYMAGHSIQPLEQKLGCLCVSGGARVAAARLPFDPTGCAAAQSATHRPGPAHLLADPGSYEGMSPRYPASTLPTCPSLACPASRSSTRPSGT